MAVTLYSSCNTECLFFIEFHDVPIPGFVLLWAGSPMYAYCKATAKSHASLEKLADWMVRGELADSSEFISTSSLKIICAAVSLSP
eukprot:6170395-Amphidinium_carterae.1